ncbi:FG-GAP-like repeat-containing protein [Reichenbachiella agarivorans]|uniref:FG-GAP-like repeat-containing protein n=1 Tax=Reichenbachiella agarivorans TaxID=2979464 RepID=A0ABY6CT14_9BACT|nr:FG-GAP-like repeat-containing protein [Reichenbachiella agarivorans]UXP33662.1 FG-GAP-like repeat-containing protein [Reichenbachiella agarivorans]
MKIIYTVSALFIGTWLQAQNFTKLSVSAFEPMTGAKAEWADFNNDGLPDLFVAGTNSGGISKVRIYFNNGDQTFQTLDLVNWSKVSYDIGDYNADGYLDLLISGEESGGTKHFKVFKNSNGLSFSPQSFGLISMSRGGVAWSDLDGDGDLDIVATGLDQSFAKSAVFYQNKNSAYEPVSLAVDLFSLGTVDCLDANNDGRIEVLLTGFGSDGEATSIMYTIGQNWSISEYTIALKGYGINSTDMADYNEDGYIDLAFTGFTEAASEESDLYTNNQSSFTQASSFLKKVSASSIEFADLNNDGLQDILICGLQGADVSFEYYQNAGSAGSYSFGTVAHTMENIYEGDIAVADFDLDGDLDVFQIGNSDLAFQSNFYASDAAVTYFNLAPEVPTSGVVVSQGDSVILNWSAVTDDLTSSNSITYNVYVSREAGGSDLLLSPHSLIATGYRQVATIGNAGFSTSKKIASLPEGNYYWAVQAIDGQYKGSAFSSEETFSVCYPVKIGKDTSICQNEYVTLSITDPEADVVNWYSKTDGLLLADALSYDHQALTKDTIIAEVTKTYGCVRYDTLIVSVYDLPAFNLGSDQTICYGEYFDLSVSDLGVVGLDSVNWYSTGLGSLLLDSEDLSYEVLTKDTLVAEVFNVNGCVSYDSLVVSVYDLPVFNLGSDQTICYGEYFDLSVSGLGVVGLDSVNWYSTGLGSLLLNSEDLSYEVLTKDTLIAEIFNVNGCVNYDSLIVSVYDLPSFDLGNDTTVCYGGYFDLSVSDLGVVGLDFVNWYSTGLGSLLLDSETLSYEVLTKDTLIAEVVNVNGCINYDSLILSVYDLPVFDIGADTAICYGNSVILIAGAMYDEVNWYNYPAGSSLNLDSWFFNYEVLVTDTIVAEVYDMHRCLNYDTIAIEMNVLPDYTIGEDLNICLEDTAKLLVPGSWEEVNWYTVSDQLLAQDNPEYEFEVEETLTLWSEVFTDKGCVQYDTLIVNALALPFFDLAEEEIYCFGDSINLSVEVGSLHQWMGQEGLLSLNPSWKTIASSSDVVSLYVEDEHACHYSDTLTLTVNPLPIFEIEGIPEICLGDSTELSVAFANMDSIHWYTQSASLAVDESSIFFSPSEDSWLYTALVDQNRCLSTDSVQVVVNSLPQALAGADSLICYETEVQLGDDYSEEGWSYLWSSESELSDSQVQRPIVSPLVDESYFLKVTNHKGCLAYDTIQIYVNSPIVINAGEDLAICLGDEVALGTEPTASGSLFEYAYTWSSTTIVNQPNESNPLVSPEETSTYYLKVKSAYCPEQFDTVTVVVNYAPEITVSPQLSVGPDESVLLEATGGVEYIWSPDNTLDDPLIATPEASPLVTTTYSVLVTDSNGCESSGEVTVLVQNVLFIPNLFTPNGDQNNDQFMVYGSGIAKIDFQVFDMHGNQVYHTSDVEKATTQGWDGSYRGQMLPSGTYIWSLSGAYHDGTPLEAKGHNKGTIKLLR